MLKTSSAQRYKFRRQHADRIVEIGTAAVFWVVQPLWTSYVFLIVNPDHFSTNHVTQHRQPVVQQFRQSWSYSRSPRLAISTTYLGSYLLNLPTTNTTVCEMKQVSFYPEVSIQSPQGEDQSYTSDDERKMAWYSLEELKSIRMECRVIVAMVIQESSSTSIPQEMNCTQETRGLERHIRCSTTPKQACQAVLREQSMQRAEKFEDQSEIAEVYQEYSLRCTKEALNRAVRDRQEVEHALICDEIEHEVSGFGWNSVVGLVAGQKSRSCRDQLESERHVSQITIDGVRRL